MRESLDKFTPDIFDRPVHDLISATAASAWRREREHRDAVHAALPPAPGGQGIRPPRRPHRRPAQLPRPGPGAAGRVVRLRHDAAPPGGPVRPGRDHWPCTASWKRNWPNWARPSGTPRPAASCTARPYEELMERLERLVADTGDAGDPAGADAPGGEHARARPRRAAGRPCRARSSGRLRGRRTRARLVAVRPGSHDQRRRLPGHVRRRRAAPARSRIPSRGQRPHRQRRRPPALEAGRTLAGRHRGAPAAGGAAAQPAQGRPGNPAGPDRAGPGTAAHAGARVVRQPLSPDGGPAGRAAVRRRGHPRCRGDVAAGSPAGRRPRPTGHCLR